MFNFFSELKNKYKEISNKLNPYQIITMGDHLMYVEGNLTIMTLTQDNIVFKVNDGVIIVVGKNLNLKEISKNTLTIIGKIISWEKV